MNPAPRMSPLFWILLLALGSLASTGCSRSPVPPDTARQATPRPGGTYSAARHGGGYMHNYYLPPAPSATPWAPAWSPDGKQIAVGLQGSIWRIDLASREAFELTYDGHYHSSPDWSPDGRWIVYATDHGGHTIQLQILNLETGESHALTDDAHLYADPVFSPDGDRLAYVSTEPSGYFNIYVRPIREGRWAGPATALTRDHSYGKNRLYFGEWDMHIQPAWTPDGNELLLLSNRGVPLGSGHVWRMPAEGPSMARAEPILEEQSLYRTRPHVSHDGKRFIYSSTGGASDQFSHLYVLPITGGAPYKLTFGGYDHFHPRWSPDGERIAYISNQPSPPSGPGLPRLWLMETYGGRKERVTPRKFHWKRPMGILRAEVRDGSTRRKTGARIYGRAADGKFYPPKDSYARVSILGEPLFHTGGEFEMTLPPGKMTLEAVKGLEYRPARQEVEIRAGEVSRVSLVLSPMVDMAAKGWYSGSTHVHMNYGGNLRNTLENLMFLATAEDQDVVCELIANKDNRILDWDAFVPQQYRTPGFRVRSQPGGDRGGGVPPPLSRPRLAAGPSRPSHLPLHHRLRRHWHREPLPQQHRHVPQGQGSRCPGRICSRLFRGNRSSGKGPDPRQDVSRGCRPGHGRYPGVVLAQLGYPACLAPHPQQRPGHHPSGGRGRHHRPAPVHPARGLQNLRTPERKADGRILDRVGAAGKNLHQQRSAAGLPR